MNNYLERPIKAFNPWLRKGYSGRGSLIAGVMIHATRGGTSDGDDGPGTENWWSNPSNVQYEDGVASWGSYADLLIWESGVRIVCTDINSQYATWTAGYGAGAGTWAAGIYYIQIETAQGRTEDPYTYEEIDSLAQKVAEYSNRYNFPITRIPYLEQVGEPPRGICTHEDSANGRASGKTDPGYMFPWPTFLSLAQGYKDGNQPAEELSVEDKLMLNILANIVARNGMKINKTDDVVKVLADAKIPINWTKYPVQDDGSYLVTGDDCLFFSQAMGYSFALGLRNTQIAVQQVADALTRVDGGVVLTAAEIDKILSQLGDRLKGL